MFFNKHALQVLEIQDPNIFQPCMLNSPLNWDGYVLCSTENIIVEAMITNEFIKQYCCAHSSKFVAIVNEQHAKMKVPSFVDSYVFINT